jgi:aldose 1-epimerase
VSAPAPSGRQVALRHGAWSATVVEVGGGIRELTHDGVPVLDGYGVGEMASGGRGQPLLPWPNRLAGGRYAFAGRTIQAPVSEPSTGSAIHGLTRWVNWPVLDAWADGCTMGLRLHPQPAYPFTLDLRIDYELSDAGLEVALGATNAGDGDLPFGAGFHPYLSAGSPLVDGDRLTLEAPAPPERDFRGGRGIGEAVVDDCYTGLARDADGLARVRLESPSGRAVVMWLDGLWSHVMVFTGDTLAPARRRRGLAVEPMTCAPDAFNTGEGLRVLAPGESVTGRWGIGLELP